MNRKKAVWLQKRAEELRERATPAELRACSIFDEFNVGYEFQKPCGDFAIVDIFIPGANLYLEVDGGYHNSPEQRAKDLLRDRKIQRGELLRFTNESIFNDPNRFIFYFLSRIRHKLQFYRSASVQGQIYLEKIQHDIVLPKRLEQNRLMADRIADIKGVVLSGNKLLKKQRKNGHSVGGNGDASITSTARTYSEPELAEIFFSLIARIEAVEESVRCLRDSASNLPS